MAECIDRRYIRKMAMLEQSYKMDTVNDAKTMLRMIDDAPTVDVAPVKHGRWDDSGRYTFPGGSTAVRCTECGCALTESEYHLQNWNYCPVCGAKMDGGAENGTEEGD